MAGMSKTRRRNCKRKGLTPETLAARLPDELRSFGAYTDPSDLRAHAGAVRAWLNQVAPGLANDQSIPVMEAAGLTVASWYRTALIQQRN